MPAKLKKTTITTRIIWVLLAIFFLVMVVSQLYIYFDNPLKVEAALHYSTTDSIVFKGVYVRNERLVRYSDSGIIVYNYENGSKLAKNSVVAKSYSSQRDIALQKQIDELEGQKQVLVEAQKLENTDNSQLESFNNQINNKHAQLLKQLSGDAFSGVETLKSDYLSLKSKKQIVRGTVVNYTEKIIELEGRIATLRSQISAQPRDVRIDEAGYFVSVVDGYESALSYSNIEQMTKEEISGIIQNPAQTSGEQIIGKIIDDYKWKLISSFTFAETQRLAASSVFEGASVKMRVGTGNIVDATVSSVQRFDDGSSIYIFECDRMAAEFVESRVGQFRLLLDEFTGIYISSRAIEINNETEEAGVYVLNGAEVVFKKIDIIMSMEDYVLAADTSGKPGYLWLYDSVVVEGKKNMYEGKIVA